MDGWMSRSKSVPGPARRRPCTSRPGDLDLDLDLTWNLNLYQEPDKKKPGNKADALNSSLPNSPNSPCSCVLPQDAPLCPPALQLIPAALPSPAAPPPLPAPHPLDHLRLRPQRSLYFARELLIASRADGPVSTSRCLQLDTAPDIAHPPRPWRVRVCPSIPATPTLTAHRAPAPPPRDNLLRHHRRDPARQRPQHHLGQAHTQGPAGAPRPRHHTPESTHCPALLRYPCPMC